jgi:hypothetical protein
MLAKAVMGTEIVRGLAVRGPIRPEAGDQPILKGILEAGHRAGAMGRREAAGGREAVLIGQRAAMVPGLG